MESMYNLYQFPTYENVSASAAVSFTGSRA